MSEVVRLYRRDPEVYYVGHIHEQVEYRLAALGRTVGRAGFFIHHFGWYRIDAESWRRKQELYTSLLAEKHRQRPGDALAMLQYGDALCAWSGKMEEGLALLMRAAHINSKLPDVWLYIALALLRLHQGEAALIAMEQMGPEEKRKPRVTALCGDMLASLQRWDEARTAYIEAIRQEPKALPTMVKLALLEINHGFRESGLWRMEDAVAFAETQAAAHRRAQDYLQAAELRVLMKDWEQALKLATAGIALDAALQTLHELKLRASVAVGDLHEAATAAAALAELAPAPRAFLRHAAILSRTGEIGAAREVLSRGLVCFPNAGMLLEAQKELLEQAVPDLPVGGLPFAAGAAVPLRLEETAWSM